MSPGAEALSLNGNEAGISVSVEAGPAIPVTRRFLPDVAALELLVELLVALLLEDS